MIDVVKNWYICVALVALFAMCACAIANVIINLVDKKNDDEKQKNSNVKEWLRYAVIECQKQLGTKTGQAKLARCYDMAIQRFPWILEAISFQTFSAWVDEAVKWLDRQLASNAQLRDYVEGGRNEI